MTMHSTSPVSCPACGREQAFDVWRTLNATLNPELRDRLLSGQLTAFTCDACGHRADVVYPLLYHDMQKQFMVWFVPGEGQPESLDASLFGALGKGLGQGYTYRLVRTRNELVEKIRIFEDGLDDRVVELLKAFLRHGGEEAVRGAEGSLFYDRSLATPGGGRQVRLILVGGAEAVAVALKADAYDDMKSRFEAALPAGGQRPGEWLEVNQDYALGLLESFVKKNQGGG
jgi:hypothetical protein